MWGGSALSTNQSTNESTTQSPVDPKAWQCVGKFFGRLTPSAGSKQTTGALATIDGMVRLNLPKAYPSIFSQLTFQIDRTLLAAKRLMH